MGQRQAAAALNGIGATVTVAVQVAAVRQAVHVEVVNADQGADGGFETIVHRARFVHDLSFAEGPLGIMTDLTEPSLAINCGGNVPARLNDVSDQPGRAHGGGR